MKRLIVTIGGRAASAEDIKAADKAASRQWSAHWRVAKVQEKRRHRKLTDEEREAKRQRTAQRKREREAQRHAREHEALMRRIKFIVERIGRDEERARRIKVSYKPGREPRFKTVCPQSLYRRVHPYLPGMPGRPARTAADGFRNIVLKRSCRGFGKKAPGTRAYKAGEAGRASRYIARAEGIEDVEGAVLTNVLGHDIVAERCFSIEQQQGVVGFFDALEEIERATGESHVYSHVIVAMPFELGPEGRAAALHKFCTWFHVLGVPFSAALHKPDPEGSQRNFHAHIVVGTRPFEYQGPYSWSFDAGKITELVSAPATQELRSKLAQFFNAELKGQNSPIQYSGVAQAERGVPALSDTHKGQKAVAAERLAAADEALARKLISGAVSHVSRLISELAGIKAKVSQLGRDRVSEVEADEPRSDVEVMKADEQRIALEAVQSRIAQQRRLRELEVAGLSADEEETNVIPEPDRGTVIMSSLDDYGRHAVTTSMEALALALRRVPQSIALGMRNGMLQVACADPDLKPALAQIVQSPSELSWLTKLANRIPFDHAAVPAAWHEVHMHPDRVHLPLRTEYWAQSYGGVAAEPSIVTSIPVRGFER